MGYENSGRRPQSTKIKLLRGNPSHQKVNVNEPTPPSGEVTKPAGLSAGAGAMWDELAPICLAMGTLTLADLRPFVSLCELQATFNEAAAAKDGRTLFHLKHDEDDPTQVTVKVDGILKLERETANGLRPYYELFGLTPVARARISVPKRAAAEPVSKWAGALK